MNHRLPTSWINSWTIQGKITIFHTVSIQRVSRNATIEWNLLSECVCVRVHVFLWHLLLFVQFRKEFRSWGGGRNLCWRRPQHLMCKCAMQLRVECKLHRHSNFNSFNQSLSHRHSNFNLFKLNCCRICIMMLGAAWSVMAESHRQCPAHQLNVLVEKKNPSPQRRCPAAAALAALPAAAAIFFFWKKNHRSSCL